jgi:hypothetical protein
MNGSPAPASGPGTPLWCGLLGLFQPILFPFSVPGSASAGIERAVSTAEATINFFNFVSLTLSFPTPRKVYTELDLGCRARRLLFNSRLLTVVLDRRKKSHKASSLPIRYAVFNTASALAAPAAWRCWRRSGRASSHNASNKITHQAV